MAIGWEAHTYIHMYIYVSLSLPPSSQLLGQPDSSRKIFLILVIKIWKYFGVYFFVVAFFTPFCPDFKKTNFTDFLLRFFSFFLYFENNFSCSPLWKIVFQSRKHSWNFIAACFIKKKWKRKYKSQKEKQKEKIRGRQIQSSSGGKIVERIFAERCNNKSFSRVLAGGGGWQWMAVEHHRRTETEIWHRASKCSLQMWGYRLYGAYIPVGLRGMLLSGQTT